MTTSKTEKARNAKLAERIPEMLARATEWQITKRNQHYRRAAVRAIEKGDTFRDVDFIDEAATVVTVRITLPLDHELTNGIRGE